MTLMKEESQSGRPEGSPVRVVVVGLGGMGINSLNHLGASSEVAVTRVAIDTDRAVLDSADTGRRIQIGIRLAQGQSTGGDVDLGRRSVNANLPEIRALFVNVDIAIILTGLGGGVGSGGGPVVAQIARDEGALVISASSLPFPFEGDARMHTAEEALEKLRQAGHAAITLPNRYLLAEAVPDQPLPEAFSRAAGQLGAGFAVLWKLLGRRTLINLDFISLKNMLEGSDGLCSFVYAEGAGKGKVRLVLQRIAEHPALQEHGGLGHASGLLIGLLGGEDLTLTEVEEIMQGVTGAVRSNARQFMGVGIDPARRNQVGVLLLVGGRVEEPVPERLPEVQPAKPRKTVTPARPDRPAGKAEQKELELPTAPPSKGRFKDVEPSIYHGEDVDLPTFLRRGMKLSR